MNKSLVSKIKKKKKKFEEKFQFQDILGKCLNEVKQKDKKKFNRFHENIMFSLCSIVTDYWRYM